VSRDTETIITYIIASICLIIAVVGFFVQRYEMTESTLKWLIGFAVFLTVERDLSDFIGR